jgi:hypothetical protein
MVAPGDVAGLIAAVQLANERIGADTIVLSPGTYTLSDVFLGVVSNVPLENGGLFIRDEVTILGNGATITSNSVSLLTLILTAAYSNVTLKDLILTGANGAVGGAINMQGIMTLERVTISNNSAYWGAGILNYRGLEITIRDSLIENNQAIDQGGGIWSCSPGTISNTIIRNNQAVNRGGGVFTCGFSTISDVLFESNQASYGGGIFVWNGAPLAPPRIVNISNSRFIGNQATNFGGAIANTGAGEYIVANRVIFDNNLAVMGSILYNATADSLESTYNITESCLLGRHDDIAVSSQSGTPANISITSSWWGSSTGPGGETYNGSGSIIGVPNVVYQPFEVTPILDCRTHSVTGVQATVSVPFATSQSFTLQARNGVPPYTFTVLQQPLYGTLSGSAPNLTFTPIPGFTGFTGFHFQVQDSVGSTSTTYILFDVQPAAVLTAPDIDDTTSYQTPINRTFLVEGGQPPFTYRILQNPQHGSISGDLPAFRYVPDNNFSGRDEFTLEVTDASGRTDTAIWRIRVMPLNYAELKTMGSALIANRNIPLQVNLNVTGGLPPYTLEILTQPIRGTLSGSFDNLTYTSSQSNSGLDAFTYRIIDSLGFHVDGTIYIEVNPTVAASPAHNAIINAVRPTFTWPSFADATQYQLQIATDSGFANLVIDRLVNGTSYTVADDQPAFTQRQYYWRTFAVVDGSHEFQSSTRSFTVSGPFMPPPVLPPGGLAPLYTTSQVSISWDSQPGATGYDLEIDDSNAFTAPISFQWQGSTTNLTTPALANGVYYLRLRTLNAQSIPGAWSTVHTFYVNTTPPPAPALLSPASRSMIATARPTLTWGAAPGVNRYQVVIDTDSLCDATPSPVIAARTYISPVSLAQGTYYWCVRSLNASGNIGLWSEPREFTINILSQPADGATILTTTPWIGPTLTWAPVPGAAGYRIQIATEPTFTSPIENDMGVSTSYRINAGLSYGTYYWRVTPYGMTPSASIYRRFTLTPNLLPAPTIPAGLMTARYNTPTVTIQWTAVPQAFSYEVQVDTTNTFAAPLSFSWQGEQNFVTTTALPDAMYYYRVRTINRFGAAGAWTVVRSLTVDTTPPAPPALLTPANGGLVATTRPTLTWAVAADSTRYQTVIDTDALCDATPNVAGAIRSYTSTVSLPQGTYYWCVRGIDAVGNTGAWSAARSFNVNILSAPLNGANILSAAATANPVLSWAVVPGATGYSVQIATDAGFSNPTTVALGRVTSYRVNPGLPYGTYYWQVIPTGFAQSVPVYRQFTITPNVPAAPVIPVNAVAVRYNTAVVALQWNAVNGAVGYDVQVDNSNPYTAPLSFQWSGATTAVTTSALPDGVYYLRVRAINVHGAAGAWSVLRAFTVDTTPPPAPVLVAPASGVTISTTRRPIFSWRAAPTATAYILEVATDAAFSTIISSNGTASLSLILPVTHALPNGTYYWRVRARDAAGNVGAASSPRTVTIAVR